MNGALTPATVSRSAATLWVGVMAGFFYAFSAVVMPGLSAADPAVAIEAMQAINAAVRNIASPSDFSERLWFVLPPWPMPPTDGTGRLPGWSWQVDAFI